MLGRVIFNGQTKISTRIEFGVSLALYTNGHVPYGCIISWYYIIIIEIYDSNYWEISI